MSPVSHFAELTKYNKNHSKYLNLEKFHLNPFAEPQGCSQSFDAYTVDALMKQTGSVMVG